MAMDFITKDLSIKVPVADIKEKMLVEGELILPDMKPNIGRIISASAVCNWPEARIGSGKLDIDGEIQATVIYVGDEGEVKNAKQAIPFQMNIKNQELEDGMSFRIKPTIEGITAKPMNERKMQLKVELLANVEAWSEKSLAIVEEISEPADTQMLKEDKEIEVYSGRACETFKITSELAIPNSVEQIWEILDARAHIVDYRFEDMGGYGELKGNVKVHAIYTVDEEMRNIQLIEEVLPFESMLSMESIGEANRFDEQLLIRSADIFAKEDDLGELTKIGVELELESDLQCFHDEQAYILQDAFAPAQPLSLKKESFLRLEKKPIADGHFSSMLRMEVDDPFVPVNEIVDIISRVRDVNVHVDGSKAFINGSVELRILYHGIDDAGLRAISHDIPFERDIDLVSEDGQLEAPLDAITATVQIENAVCSIVSPNLLEPRVDMGFKLSKRLARAQELTTEVEEIPAENSEQSEGDIIVCTVQANEKLWDIAKRHLVRLDDVTDLEGSMVEEDVCPGQRIMIQRF